MLASQPLLTLGGTETFLQFLDSFPLREFAAFELFADDDAFARYEREFLIPTADAALAAGFGLLLDSLVWRATPDWLPRLGYEVAQLDAITWRAVSRMRKFGEDWRRDRGERARDLPIVVSGAIGPRGDGYRIDPSGRVDIEQARAYHAQQLGALDRAGADWLGAWTLTNTNEAIGMVLAARDLARPFFVSATVETDGRLPDGSTLREFVERIDAATDSYPACYLVNCAHPTHLQPTLDTAQANGEQWLERLAGFRANASNKTHAELDESDTLDAGDPDDLGRQLAAMRHTYGWSIVGGCCGTDARHMVGVARSCSGEHGR